MSDSESSLNGWLSFPWWALVLMLIGVISTFRWIIWPMIYVILYGIGNSIFNLLLVHWGKARKMPHKVIWYALIVWPWEGMKKVIISGPSSSVTARNWEWEPLFKYRRRER